MVATQDRQERSPVAATQQRWLLSNWCNPVVIRKSPFKAKALEGLLHFLKKILKIRVTFSTFFRPYIMEMFLNYTKDELVKSIVLMYIKISGWIWPLAESMRDMIEQF